MNEAMLSGVEMREQVGLAERTTLGVGGAARFFCEVRSEGEIPEGLEWARERGMAVFILGGGSNVLISDRGVAGLVMQIGLRGIRYDGSGGVVAAAGESWDGVVRSAVERGWAGIECLSGIPGTVGATPVQNVGAYGQEVASAIESVRAWDRKERGWVELSGAECGFGYRTSRFNRGGDAGRFVIAAVGYRLQPGGRARLRYPDLQRRFPGGEAGLGEARAAVLEIRRGKGMLIEPDTAEAHSAGSFFKNPVLTAAEADALAARAGAEPPRFTSNGKVKIPAAWLIEQAGFQKGFRQAEGRVGLSSRHVLALINADGGSAGEIVRLARQIQAEVERRLGVRLQAEPVQAGFEPGEEI